MPAESKTPSKEKRIRIKKCSKCGIYPQDYPSPYCCGCDAYREHQDGYI